MPNQYKIHQGQSLFDLAVHQYGSIEPVFELAAISKLSLTDKLPAGTIIELPKHEGQINSYVVASIQSRSLVPRTAPDAINEAGGIGHMQVWVSFQVSSN
jgi:hypothetical protein